jgi:hypothetical protein
MSEDMKVLSRTLWKYSHTRDCAPVGVIFVDG